MMSRRAAALAALLLAAAAPVARAGDPAPSAARRAHHARRAAPVKPEGTAVPTVAPLFPEAGRAETAAERAASLERRRKAFFAKPAEGDETPGAPAAPIGVTLGGSGGLTPGLGMKF